MWGKADRSDWFYHFRSNIKDGAFLCGAPLGACVVLPDLSESNHCSKCVALQHQIIAISPPATKTNAEDDGSRHAIGQSKNLPARKYIGRRTPVDLATRDHEDNYLLYTLQIIEEQTEETRKKRHSNRRGSIHSEAALGWRERELQRKQEMLQSMQGSPYFARMDFAADDEQHSTLIYVGKSILDDNSDTFVVYDWRDPICTMFYQHDLGNASYRAPKEVIHGKMLLKRQFDIQNGRMLACHDLGTGKSGEQSADAMLIELLQRNSSGTMRQIVQSIQAEQDTVIRANGDIIVVQGPAGSGKTVVALHRAAYLLYHLRTRHQQAEQRFGIVSARRMLVYSPNSIFSSYIARVLPDLNEDQITQSVLEHTIQERLQKLLPSVGQNKRYLVESRDDYFEYIINPIEHPTYEARIDSSALKSSPEMITIISLYVQGLEEQIETIFHDIELSKDDPNAADVQSQIIYSQDLMQKEFRRLRLSTSLVGSIKGVLNSIGDKIKDYSRSLSVQKAMVTYLERQWQSLRVKLLFYEKMNLPDAYTILINHNDLWQTAFGQKTSASRIRKVIASTAVALLDHKVAYEDIVPMLLLNGHLRGFPLQRDIDHAVIDEAQDYSLLHYEYIKHCLPERCSLTIVGDVNQAINPILNLHNYDSLESIFPSRITRLELARSYRSSVEITDFASQILPGMQHIDNVRRTGNKPKLVPALHDDTANVIAILLERLANQNYNTIAILCKTRRDSQRVFDQLHTKMAVTLLTDSTSVQVQGIVILPVQLAKGLEFDVVIVHDAGQAFYSRDEERKLLYTACTRALHDLYVCYSGRVSPLLGCLDNKLYDSIFLVN